MLNYANHNFGDFYSISQNIDEVRESAKFRTSSEGEIEAP